MTDLNEKARQAARSVMLTVVARILSVATPLILGPMIYFAAGTLGDLKDTNSALKIRVEVLERAEARREVDSRTITNRRDDQITEIVQRLARVETQSTAMVDALNRLTDRLDRQQRRGDMGWPTKKAEGGQ